MITTSISDRITWITRKRKMMVSIVVWPKADRSSVGHHKTSNKIHKNANCEP